MNSKQQLRESCSRDANSSFPFDVNVILNLSIKVMSNANSMCLALPQA